MEETLLEKAKKIYTKSKVDTTDDHIDLAIAWLGDEISAPQVRGALGLDLKCSSNMMYKIALWLREAKRQGRIRVIVKSKLND